MHEALEQKPDFESVLREEYSKIKGVNAGFDGDVTMAIVNAGSLSGQKALLLRMADRMGIVLEADQSQNDISSINPPETTRQEP